MRIFLRHQQMVGALAGGGIAQVARVERLYFLQREPRQIGDYRQRNLATGINALPLLFIWMVR